MLPVHTAKAHGIDKWDLRELAGYTTRDPLCSPEARAKMSAAYDHEKGTHALAAAAARKGKRPQRWTTAGRTKNRDTLVAWEAANPEAAALARQRAAGSRTEDGERRRLAAVAAWWREHPPTDDEREAFARRMHSPEVAARRAAVFAAKRQPCGTVASYKRGCRCDACRRAKSLSRRKAS